MTSLAAQPLRGRRAIVTGAARGIGRATALLFNEAGADLLLIDRDEEELRRTAADLRPAGRSIIVAADVSDSAAIHGAVIAARGELGAIDILVNNAALQIPGGTVVDATAEDWDRFIAVNLKGPAFLAREVIPLMQAGAGGSIVNIGSLSSVVVFPGQAVYAATKGAILQLTRAIAVDFGPAAIRCNCICPGPVLAGPVLAGRSVEETARDPAVVELAAQHPLGRLARPEDIAQAVLFLAGPYSTHITGAMIVVDGGFSIR
jgi:NAD(P)-dependent dehydrogenase (short-subunit alcohol dehydrogenase family)